MTILSNEEGEQNQHSPISISSVRYLHNFLAINWSKPSSNLSYNTDPERAISADHELLSNNPYASIKETMPNIGINGFNAIGIEMGAKAQGAHAKLFSA